MLNMEEAEKVLEQAAAELPPEFYRDLNGGISLLPGIKPHPRSVNNDLYILGEYHNEPLGLGRYIVIYFGSFKRIYAGQPRDVWEQKLGEVLRHEFTHHLESLAGERGLDARDEQEIAAYLAENCKSPIPS
ncbi:MAG: metallopeptidase family protein [Clostridiales bacterium]|jgi:hypothetical protein|nr:metallopeptidase family protein [Clostridiales bacterium]